MPNIARSTAVSTPSVAVEDVTTARALAPDLARGFMLLLIAIANISIYLWGHETGSAVLHPIDGSTLDRVLAALTIVFVDGRVYPMFAFLFGYGMVQFTRSRIDRGIPEDAVCRMLRRRHVWLIVFGAVHGILLFSGDILGAYGLAGLILAALLFRRSDLAVKITIWVLVGTFALGALIMLGLGVLVSVLPTGLTDPQGAEDFGLGSVNDLMSGQANYGWALLLRLAFWIGGTLGAAISFIVPACILLGWLAGRHRWLEGGSTRFSLGAVAVWGIVIGALGGIPQMLEYLGLLPFFANTGWALSGFAQLTGVAGGLGYAALFGVLGARLPDTGSLLRRAVAAVGKRSLTFYLLQSVIFAPLLTAWGFGLGAQIGTATAFAIAVGVWIVSLVLALLLERRNARGPAEILLRRLTYGPDEAVR